MIVEVDSPAFEELIDPNAELVRLGDGYQFTEGPVWNPRDQSLYFSDIPGDARWRWSEAGGMELVVPARISDAARERVRELAVTAFRLAGCSGLARADFFVDGEDVLVNELNTMPGQTSTSAFAKLFAASGVEYPELLRRLVTLALERHEAAAAYAY